MRKVKILSVAENRVWQPPHDNTEAGAGPGVKGAWLARVVLCEVTNEAGKSHEQEFIIPEPFSLESFDKVIEEYKATLPAVDPLEGAEARIDEATREVKYFSRKGEELKLSSSRETK